MDDSDGCLHNNLQPTVDIKRFETEAVENMPSYMAEALMMSVGLFCGECGKQFEILGELEPGMGWSGPRRSVDRTIVNLPMAPPGAHAAIGLPEVDFGDPWRGAPDEAIERVIRRAMDSPASWAVEIPNQGKVAHRVRAVRIALAQFLRKAR